MSLDHARLGSFCVKSRMRQVLGHRQPVVAVGRRVELLRAPRLDAVALHQLAELNDPKTKIAVDLGSSHELIARRYAPNATITAFKTRDKAILATQSGRADCFVATIFLGLTALKKNPQLGQFIMPRPYVQASVCAAVPYDTDARFRDFLDAWAVFNRSNGQTRDWIVNSSAKVNVSPTDVPAEVTF